MQACSSSVCVLCWQFLLPNSSTQKRRSLASTTRPRSHAACSTSSVRPCSAWRRRQTGSPPSWTPCLPCRPLQHSLPASCACCAGCSTPRQRRGKCTSWPRKCFAPWLVELPPPLELPPPSPKQSLTLPSRNSFRVDSSTRHS